MSLSLELDNGTEIDEVSYEITGGDMEPMSGVIYTSAPGATASVEVFGLEAGSYTITMTATSTDDQIRCGGSADFDIEVSQVTDVMVVLRCTPPARFGAVRVNGEFNICTELTKMVAAPLQTSVGNPIDVSAAAEDAEGDDFAFHWSATGGSIADPSADATTFTCETEGEGSITVEVSDDDFEFCASGWTIPVTCVAGGGTGGTGGMGTGGAGGLGGGGETASVRLAHLAPEIPTAEDTAVDILVNGAFSGITIEFGRATAFVELPAGMYEVGIAPSGSLTPVVTVPVTLEGGDILTAVAIRNVNNAASDEPPVAVLAFPGDTEGLAEGLGRVLVGHGADDTLLDPVGVVNAAACPPPIIDEFFFNTVGGPLDLPETVIPVGFALRPADGDPCVVAAGPLDAPVTPDVVTILVAVDEDVVDGMLAPAIYALIGDASGEIPALAPTP